MTWRMLGKAGLNVTTNGILLDPFLVDILRALLRGIWRTLSILSLMKRYLYPLLIRWLVSASDRALKNSPVEQILLSRKAMLKGMDCLVWDLSLSYRADLVKRATTIFPAVPVWHETGEFFFSCAREVT